MIAINYLKSDTKCIRFMIDDNSYDEMINIIKICKYNIMDFNLGEVKPAAIHVVLELIKLIDRIFSENDFQEMINSVTYKAFNLSSLSAWTYEVRFVDVAEKIIDFASTKCDVSADTIVNIRIDLYSNQDSISNILYESFNNGELMFLSKEISDEIKIRDDEKEV